MVPNPKKTLSTSYTVGERDAFIKDSLTENGNDGD